MPGEGKWITGYLLGRGGGGRRRRRDGRQSHFGHLLPSTAYVINLYPSVRADFSETRKTRNLDSEKLTLRNLP